MPPKSQDSSPAKEATKVAATPKGGGISISTGAAKVKEGLAKHWRSTPKNPVVKFSPYAWAKLWYMLHRGHTEVGGFGISKIDDPLTIIDFQLVKQECSAAYCAFDDEGVSEFTDDMVDHGLQPAQFLRIWIHTHPGASPSPSGQDEETFARVFSTCNWSLMFILAKEGATYARLRFSTGGIQAHMLLEVEIDYTIPFNGADRAQWNEEYKKYVKEDRLVYSTPTYGHPRLRIVTGKRKRA